MDFAFLKLCFNEFQVEYQQRFTFLKSDQSTLVRDNGSFAAEKHFTPSFY